MTMNPQEQQEQQASAEREAHDPLVMEAGQAPLGAMSLKRAGLVVLGALILGACVVPLDPMVAELMQKLRLRGDMKRELEFVQQFGAITSCVIIAVAIGLLDPLKRKYLPRAVVACVGAAAGVWVCKTLIGRPRPKMNDPFHFGGPWEQYVIPQGEGKEAVTAYAWEFWRSGIADIWSMPSSHTSAAFVLAATLTRFYPKLKPLVVVIACLVGFARVAFGAHYVSDVVVGAGIGWAVGWGVGYGGRGRQREIARRDETRRNQKQ